MITEVSIYSSVNETDESMRHMVAAICDKLAELGYASDSAEGDSEVISVVVAKQFDVSPENMEEFLFNTIDGSLLAAIPINKEKENDE